MSNGNKNNARVGVYLRISKEDINGTNTLIVNLNKAIDVQNNTFNSLNSSFSNFMDDMNSRYDSFSSMQKMMDTINTDIKTTSIKQPQSSCPFRDSKQKIFGLGYNLLVFVYDKQDYNNTCKLNFQNCTFISANILASSIKLFIVNLGFII